jgi:CNT family concentrative nucleoside transporter
MNLIVQSIVGYVGLLGIAWLICKDKSHIQWRTVSCGALLQWVLALLILKLPAAQTVFASFNQVMLSIEQATREGTSLVFGYLGGAAPPFEVNAGSSTFILAFQALPIVLVMSALSALLFYWRVLPWLVSHMSTLLERVMGVGGAVSLSTAANVFLGMVEAPLVIKPYLEKVSRGEMFVILTAGMAGVAGSVMGLYAAILGPLVPNALGHILAASFISAPAAIMFASLMIPHQGHGTGSEQIDIESDYSAMSAVYRGTAEGLQLLLNIIACLIVAVALLAIINQLLAWIPHEGAAWSLQRILGLLLMPIAWLAGIPWAEAGTAGALLGTKTILNELVAYIDLSRLPAESLSPRSRLIMTYALCGFANIGSLGIMIGGLTTMIPSRRLDILELAPKTLLSGTLATLSCGAVVGFIDLVSQT